ncbi:MAG: STAS domain-containing protein [Sinobacterium sp.]|nr:STAS domain-containing protein [Sinobacterium sp.]
MNMQKNTSIEKKELNSEHAHIVNTKNTLRISLSKDISIRCIDNLYSAIDDMLKPKNFTAIDINANQVSSIDTAGMQLVLALQQQADICEWQFSVSEMSDTFVDLSHLLGIDTNKFNQ